MSRIIHILPEQVASQIAAGEVVERPASALKELVENSLDAGARAVAVELERGGGGLIAVSDDGAGMGREDAVLALRRHATSKIRDAADLTAIRTLGFRGEALAAIASVSRMVLRTRRPGDEHGVELVATGGEVERVTACAIAPGTRIEVRELFFNTPARLKFMKTVATEQAAATGAIQRLALGHRNVAFSLVADGRSLLAAPRAAAQRERLRQLFGAHLAERMLEFDVRTAAGRAWGLAATSQESYPTPRLVLTFVNGRAVRDRMLARAIAQAYANLIPRGRHPAVALFLDLPPAAVDVNVHPMKTEVRFRGPGAVFDLVHRALRARLADQTSAGAGAVIERGYGDIADDLADVLAGDTAGADGGIARGRAMPTAPAAAAMGGDEQRLRLVAGAPASTISQRALGLGYGGAQTPAAPGAIAAPGGAPVPRYAELRVLGQLFAGYIVLEDHGAAADGGLLLVDQHAAHERVTFERLTAEWRAGGVRSQVLLVPATVELAPARAAQVAAGLAELRALGFELEPFGPATLLLKGVPAVFDGGDGVALLTDLLDGLGEHGLGARGAGAFEDLLKRLACHGSVRVGRMLQPGEISALLTALDATPFKSNCPHGRPVHIRFARNQIERLFRR